MGREGQALLAGALGGLAGTATMSVLMLAAREVGLTGELPPEALGGAALAAGGAERPAEGADYELGEWCGDATVAAASFQTESGWGWAYNFTNQWVSSPAREKRLGLSCPNHTYGAKGWHNVHDPNSTQVDDYENTYEITQ